MRTAPYFRVPKVIERSWTEVIWSAEGAQTGVSVLLVRANLRWVNWWRRVRKNSERWTIGAIRDALIGEARFGAGIGGGLFCADCAGESEAECVFGAFAGASVGAGGARGRDGGERREIAGAGGSARCD